MITLVLGGTRSGKSVVAERLVAAMGGPVTYVATASVDPSDADHAARIERHRARRPAAWTDRGVRRPRPAGRPLRAVDGTVLLDSLGTWVSGHPELRADPTDLVAALTGRRATPWW